MMEQFSFIFYNTENFYDTIDDPETMDDEFTPTGRLRWDERKFNDKLEKLTFLFQDIVKPSFPDIIGLAEIENKNVMTCILDNMRRHGMERYSFVHYDSPDERGSDVAMIYNTQSFTVLESRPILVHLNGIEDRTRDILYVKGNTSFGETIHIYIVHFPSRREGREKSERRRNFAATLLHDAVYRVLNENPDENILIMGDFNDTPDDKSVAEVLGARKTVENISSSQLYNLTYPRHKKGIGSTFHKGWLLFDQFIVSGQMLISSKIDCRPEYADVFNPKYLLHFNKNGRPVTNRTYRSHYTGGFSDHLPIHLKIFVKEV
jgi:endonuclease/exonuclease/phosphatase family metal-dependent hydrolase